MKMDPRISSKPSKVRKRMYNASFVRKRKMLSATLAPELREKYNRRSFPVRKGDEVKIMRGYMHRKGLIGKVIKVDYKKMRIYVEGISIEKEKKTVYYPIHPSKVMIIKLDLKDKKRKMALERKIKEEGGE